MKKRVLVVDDDNSVRSSLRKILMEAGYETTVAEDGEAAAGEFGKADLLILDLNLPIQDGWDVLGYVNSEHPLLPVIVITGLADQLDETTIPGAAAFLEKPIEVPLLLQTVEHLLSLTPGERMKESLRSTEVWALPFARPGQSDHRSKTGARRFRLQR